MKTHSLIAAVLSAAALSAGCSGAGDSPIAVHQEAILGEDSHLYLRCNATDWVPNDATRLVQQQDPYLFSLTYEVTEDWMVSDFDTCIFTETDELNGWGTEQTHYGRQADELLSVPGGDYLDTQLDGEDEHFDVTYPHTGFYTVTVNWKQGTFSVEQAVQFDPAVDHRLEIVGTSDVMDVKNASLEDGVPVWQWPWEDRDNQKWNLVETEDGFFEIVAKHSGKLLEVQGGSVEDGAQAQQYRDTGADHQRWSIEPVPDAPEPRFHLVAKHSGKPIELTSNLDEDSPCQGGRQIPTLFACAGALIQQGTVDGSLREQWRIEPVE